MRRYIGLCLSLAASLSRIAGAAKELLEKGNIASACAALKCLWDISAVGLEQNGIGCT